MAITDILTLPTTSRYTSPEQSNVMLPLPYGDLTENSDSGVIVPPCIDTVNQVYCVAGWPILSESAGNVVTVYDGNIELLPTDYTFDESNDYESQGAIATITLVNPPSSTITVRCKGKVSGGTLLTHPIAIIEDLFDYAETTGGLTLPSVNVTALEVARNAATTKNYTAAGVLLADNSVAYWLTSILSSFLGAWYLNSRGEVIIRFDTNLQNQMIIAGHLQERDAQDIMSRQKRENLVNRLIVNYAISYAAIDRRFKNNVNASYFRTDDGATTQDAVSIAKYGIRYARDPLNFDWTRNTATVQAIQTRLISKLSEPTWIYTITEQTFDNIHVEKGDFVTFGWERRLDENGLPLKNQIGQVISKDVDLDAETITWQVVDQKTYFPADPYLWDGTHNAGDGFTFGNERCQTILG